MKCPKCAGVMKKIVEDHLYLESGLEDVILRNITKYICPEDGSSFVQIPAMSELHRTLALAIAHKPARLLPSEVRFLRDHLGLSNTQFADLMAVTSTQSSRWTTTDPIGPQAERLLRVLVVLGPERVKPESGASSEARSEARERDAQETLGELTDMIKQLPSSSAEAKPVKIGLKRSGAGWKRDIAMSN